MKRKLLVLMLFCCFAGITNAQHAPRKWADGPLTWDDFKMQTACYSGSEINYALSYHPRRIRQHDTLLVMNVAEGIMKPGLSWVDESSKSDVLLQYNQVIFDLVELYRRRLQHALNQTSSYGASALFDNNYEAMTRRIHLFRSKSESGKNQRVIARWSDFVGEELVNESSELLPVMNIRNFGYGIHVGFTGSGTAGQLNSYFGSQYGVICGFDFSLKKYYLLVDATLSSGQMSADYKPGTWWVKGKHISSFQSNMAVGYIFCDKAHYRITPWIGAGWTGFEQPHANNEPFAALNSSGFAAGIFVDYKMRTVIQLLPNYYWGSNQIYSTCMRLGISVTQADFYSDLQGCLINFSVSYAIFGNSVRFN